MFRKLVSHGVLALAAVSLVAAPAAAQIRPVDPNEAIDADLAPLDQQPSAPIDEAPADPSVDSAPYDTAPVDPAPVEAAPPAAVPAGDANSIDQSTTFEQGDLLGAAEGVFGRGAQGLAGIIEDILRKQGKPNAYITGQEAAGAFVVGLRYGSGMLHHKVEGQRKVFWTGPSVGFDFGGNASKSFVLVYNLDDSQDLYKRFPQGEGAAYFVGGFTASYLRKGNVVLIPVRLGAGVRLGANVGYMKFSEKGRWLPF